MLSVDAVVNRYVETDHGIKVKPFLLSKLRVMGNVYSVIPDANEKTDGSNPPTNRRHKNLKTNFNNLFKLAMLR